MPVQKFRSIEEMSRAPVPVREGDFERFLRHCARYWAIAPRVYPRGVFRFRTVEDAQEFEAESAREVGKKALTEDPLRKWRGAGHLRGRASVESYLETVRGRSNRT